MQKIIDYNKPTLREKCFKKEIKITNEEITSLEYTSFYNCQNKILRTKYKNSLYEYNYDSKNNLINQIYTDERSCLKFNNFYDENNNRIRQETSDDEITNFFYDLNNKLIKEESSYKSTIGLVTSYTYDFNNNLIRTETNKGCWTNYYYDKKNNLTKIEDCIKNHKKENIYISEYTYDENNNKIKEKGKDWDFIYNEKNLLIEEGNYERKHLYKYNENNDVVRKEIIMKDYMTIIYIHEYSIRENK